MLARTFFRFYYSFPFLARYFSTWVRSRSLASCALACNFLAWAFANARYYCVFSFFSITDISSFFSNSSRYFSNRTSLDYDYSSSLLRWGPFLLGSNTISIVCLVFMISTSSPKLPFCYLPLERWSSSTLDFWSSCTLDFWSSLRRSRYSIFYCIFRLRSSSFFLNISTLERSISLRSYTILLDSI